MFLNNADASRGLSCPIGDHFPWISVFNGGNGVFLETGWSRLSEEGALPAPESSPWDQARAGVRQPAPLAAEPVGPGVGIVDCRRSEAGGV